jgi:hypothetical protein
MDLLAVGKRGFVEQLLSHDLPWIEPIKVFSHGMFDGNSTLTNRFGMVLNHGPLDCLHAC